MTEQPQDNAPETAQQPTTDEPVEPQQQPAGGGTDDGEPVQGEGSPDSY